MRVYLDAEVRHDELFTVVTAPGLAPLERPVTWAGDPGRRLLVAKDAAGGVPDAARLAEAVESGGASPGELERYGGLLFEAAFGQQAWQQLLDLATAGRRPGQPGLPYLELAIRGGPPGDPAEARSAVQALRWEALHDGTQAVAARGSTTANGGIVVDVSVGIVRLVPGDAAGMAARADGLLIGRLPRVLFAVGSSLTDPAVRPAAELMGIVQDLERDGGAIHPKVLDSATRSALRDTLRAFQPDVLHLVGHGGRLPGGQVAVQVCAEPGADGPLDQWLTAEQLLGVFGEAACTPRMVLLSACQTASVADRVNAAPFAARLVAGGVPVVIAMAGDIADTACRIFTRALSTALSHGVPLGQAVLRGRRAAFYQRPGFWSTDWALPSVFLAGHLPEHARLADPGNARVVRERVHRLGLAQAPVFYGRREFVDAMDRLLDGNDPLNVLVGYTPDSQGSYGGERLLRQLGARALRMGVLPLLLGPFDQDPPSSRAKLAREVKKSMRGVRVLLGLPALPGETRTVAAAGDPDADPDELVAAIRADLDDLVGSLPADDPSWTRVPGQPRAVLLCHRVDGWLDALDDLLSMVGPTGLHPGAVPLPVVMTGADTDPLKSIRLRQWSGRPWVKAAPLDRFPSVADEDLLAYLWWMLNPPEQYPVYVPKRDVPRDWAGLLRLFMKDCIYDEDKLYGFASQAPMFLTSEMDHDLLAAFVRAAP